MGNSLNIPRPSSLGALIGAAGMLFGMAGPELQAGVLYSNSADTTVRPGEGLGMWEGATVQDPSVGVGQIEYIRQHTVLVFQLPDLGAVVSPFDTAQLSVAINQRAGSGSGAITVSADLFGLDRRSADPTVDITDDGVADDSDIDFGAPGTLLQSAFIAPAAAPYTVSSGEGAALRDFLNGQYADGAGAGEFVFLRISPQEPDAELGTWMAKYGAYGIDSGDASSPEVRPAIIYTVAVPEPAALSLVALTSLALVRRRGR